MPGTPIAQLFAQQQGNAFSGSHPYSYQPALRPMQPNPLAQGPQMGGAASATVEGLGQVKRSSAVGGALGGGLGGSLLGGALGLGGNLVLQALKYHKDKENFFRGTDSFGQGSEWVGDRVGNFLNLGNLGQALGIRNTINSAVQPKYPSFKPDVGQMAQYGGVGAGLGGLFGGLSGGLSGWEESVRMEREEKEKKDKENELRDLKAQVAAMSMMNMMAKAGSQDNTAQRLSSAGESSGVGFKHDDEGHLTGSSAFDSLDGYMKKAGLNSFQTHFFTRMAEQEMPEALVVAAIKSAGDQFGEKVGAELEDGWEKLAGLGSWIARKGLPWISEQLFKPKTREAYARGIRKATTTGDDIIKRVQREVPKVPSGPANVMGPHPLVAKTGRKGSKFTSDDMQYVTPETQQAFKQLQQQGVNRAGGRIAGPNTATRTSDMLDVVNSPNMSRVFADQQIGPTGLSRIYHGTRGALGDMFGPQAIASTAGDIQNKLRRGGAYNPLNYMPRLFDRNARLGAANAILNPETGYFPSMMRGDGTYTNEDGSWDWRNIAANAAGNYLAARTPIGARAMRRGLMGEGAGATIAGGAGLGLNALGYDVDAAALSEGGANFGYGAGAASSLFPRSLSAKNVNRVASGLARQIPEGTTTRRVADWATTKNLAAGTPKAVQRGLDRLSRMPLFGSDRLAAGLNSRPAERLFGRNWLGKTAPGQDTIPGVVPRAASLADMVDLPSRLFGTAVRTTGLAGRRAKDYAMSNPGKAILGTAGTGGALYLGNKANNVLNMLNENEALRKEMIQNAIAQQSVGAAGGAPTGGAAGGAPGQPLSVGGGLRQVGSGIYDIIESMFGEDVADWINENKYMLMLGALGIGGGAMLGGGPGALLGGLATPLAFMLLKEQGLLDAMDNYMGIKEDGPEAPGEIPEDGIPGDGIPGDTDNDGQINAQEAKAIVQNPELLTALVKREDSLQLAQQTFKQLANRDESFAKSLEELQRVPTFALAMALGVDSNTATKLQELAIKVQQPQQPQQQ